MSHNLIAYFPFACLRHPLAYTTDNKHALTMNGGSYLARFIPDCLYNTDDTFHPFPVFPCYDCYIDKALVINTFLSINPFAKDLK